MFAAYLFHVERSAFHKHELVFVLVAFKLFGDGEFERMLKAAFERLAAARAHRGEYAFERGGENDMIGGAAAGAGGNVLIKNIIPKHMANLYIPN